MTIRQHLVILRSYAWLIVASILLAAIGAAVATFLLPRTYEAEARLYVGQSIEDRRIDVDGLEASRLIADTYAQLALSRSNLNAAIDDLRLRITADELATDVAADRLPDSTLLRLSARSNDPATAAEIANALAEALLAQAPGLDPEDEALRARVDALDTTIATVESDLIELINLPQTAAREALATVIQQRLATLIAAREALAEQLPGIRTNALTLIDPATAPIEAAGPGRVMLIGLSGAVALVVSVSLAYILAAWRAPLAIDR